MPVTRKFVGLGYGCAFLALLFGGNGVEIFIAIALGTGGFFIGLVAASRGRAVNGAAIMLLSVLFAYLGATGFQQGFTDGFTRGFQAGLHARQEPQ